MTAPRAIIWDWDGTLADGWPAVTAAVNQAFAAFGMPHWSEAETRARARRSLRESFPPIFGADWRRAAAIFQQAHLETHLTHLAPMPGAQLALAVSADLPQAVVSNKDGAPLRRECEQLGWTGHFRAVLGAGDAEADKPHPAPFALALAAIAEPPGPDVWYVGDTAIDIEGARAAGLRAILVGDAAADGGRAGLAARGLAPDQHFLDATDLAAYLSRVA
jgi:phosphoglycolate phosphatase